MKKKRLAISIPFIFTLASLLQLYYISAIAVSPVQLLRPLIIMWGGLAFLLLPVRALLHDWDWTALFLTAFALGFYFSTTFFFTILISILFVSVFWLILGRIKKLKARLQGFQNVLAGVGLFFVCYSIFSIGVMLAKIPLGTYAASVENIKTYSLDDLSSPDVKRDIYYIVLDDYARSDMLQELFGFDNSEFIDYLKGLGFIIPEDFRSNYPTTHLSVASTLNMEYVQDFAPNLEESYNRWLMKPFIDHSRVRTLLEENGYRTVSVSSNWTITENATTDDYHHPYPVMLNDFEGFVLGSTPLRGLTPFLQSFASVRSVVSQQKTVLFSFETLSAIPEVPGPKFVFTHIISPHPPFVFDKDGNLLDISYTFNFKDGNEFPGTREDYIQGYVEQLQFVNRKLQETISTIIANSEIPPIILLQADHGSGLLTDFTSSKGTCMMERFSPFAAYYLPGVEGVPSDISAVNTFRLISNEYFSAGLPLLESRQYYYKYQVPFYDFEDVTAEVNDRCN